MVVSLPDMRLAWIMLSLRTFYNLKTTGVLCVECVLHVQSVGVYKLNTLDNFYA